MNEATNFETFTVTLDSLGSQTEQELVRAARWFDAQRSESSSSAALRCLSMIAPAGGLGPLDMLTVASARTVGR
jgi:hypothetical protein